MLLAEFFRREGYGAEVVSPISWNIATGLFAKAISRST